ncbi:hypothetical protein FBY20_1365 [Achromobacter sp. SLBN-14]|nr:hypothetical protein FBY20_1365 [Achromobacter sp. SLBN-14]
MQFAHYLQTLLLALFLVPVTASATQEAPRPLLRIAPLPPLEDTLPQAVQENLERDTWFSADGSDWGITVQDGEYVETYLSPLACQRWLLKGKSMQPRTLHINGNPVDKAACRSSINKAQYIAPPLVARDVEELLFKKPGSDIVLP